ncbi:MAG: terminase small subunit [Gemmatimonadetes bacterium]|nr:terminase small subunit [Gemmatimonadota bacterium]
MPKLTKKQQAFVQEYLVDLNATRAAIDAGYSEKTARSIASENLTKPNIQAALIEAQKERSERTQIDQDFVLELLATEAKGEGPDTTASARVRAAELLAKHLGMFQDDAHLHHHFDTPNTIIYDDGEGDPALDELRKRKADNSNQDAPDEPGA